MAMADMTAQDWQRYADASSDREPLSATLRQAVMAHRSIFAYPAPTNDQEES
jgi:hypothetical protein